MPNKAPKYGTIVTDFGLESLKGGLEGWLPEYAIHFQSEFPGGAVSPGFDLRFHRPGQLVQSRELHAIILGEEDRGGQRSESNIGCAQASADQKRASVTQLALYFRKNVVHGLMGFFAAIRLHVKHFKNSWFEACSCPLKLHAYSLDMGDQLIVFELMKQA
jgi:hypothetical protein